MITRVRPLGPRAARGDDGAQPDLNAPAKYVSDELAKVVLRAMAPSPDDRFATAGQLALALSAAERPTTAPGGGRPRFPIVAATTAAVLPAGSLVARGSASLDADLV